jgi:hypothetical protein
MSVALLCQDCAETGEDVCFYIFHNTLVEQSIEEGHRVAISLHGNSPPPNNLSRKECCRHFVHSTWGRLGVGIRRKVNDCVLNDFRLQYPSLGGKGESGYTLDQSGREKCSPSFVPRLFLHTHILDKS